MVKFALERIYIILESGELNRGLFKGRQLQLIHLGSNGGDSSSLASGGISKGIDLSRILLAVGFKSGYMLE